VTNAQTTRGGTQQNWTPAAEFGRRRRRKIYGRRKSAEKKFGRPQFSRKKVIRSPPDCFPAVEFYTVKFGTKVHLYSNVRRQDGLRPQEM